MKKALRMQRWKSEKIDLNFVMQNLLHERQPTRVGPRTAGHCWQPDQLRTMSPLSESGATCATARIHSPLWPGVCRSRQIAGAVEPGSIAQPVVLPRVA